MSKSQTHPETRVNKGMDELIGQTSYSDVIKGPSLDKEFDSPYHGIEVLTDGNVQLDTPEGTRTLPMETSRVYPIEIHQIRSGNTTIGATDIMLYAK